MSYIFKLDVFYEDTDFAGIVYYANYFKFIERARTKALLSQRISQVDLKNENKFFVVRKLTADFLKPAYFEDKLLVQTCVKSIGHASVWLMQEISRDSDKIFVAKLKLAFISAGKPQVLSDNLRKCFSKLI